MLAIHDVLARLYSCESQRPIVPVVQILEEPGLKDTIMTYVMDRQVDSSGMQSGPIAEH